MGNVYIDYVLLRNAVFGNAKRGLMATELSYCNRDKEQQQILDEVKKITDYCKTLKYVVISQGEWDVLVPLCGTDKDKSMTYNGCELYVGHWKKAKKKTRRKISYNGR